MPKYNWKCLNELSWLYESCEYAWSSYMLNRLLKMSQVYISQGFEYGTVVYVYARVTQSSELWLWFQTPQKCLNMPQYALISLNMPGHGWILLNIPEYAWINYSDHASVLNMPWYSYNNIIIVIKAILY